MTQLIIDIVLSVAAGIAAFVLSWPYWRDFEYWAESRGLWWTYFIVGYVFAVYVFFIFVRCLRTLFLHDALVKSGYYAKNKPAADEKRGTP